MADLERVLAELSSLPSAEGPSRDTVRQEVFLLIAYLYLLKRDGDNALKAAWHIATDPDAPLSLRSAGWEIGCQSTILLGRWGQVHGQFELLQATSEPDLAEPEARWRRAYIEGDAYADRGRHVEAEQALRKALVFASAAAWSRPTWPMGHPRQPTGLGYSGTTKHRLGQCLLSLGRFINAEELLRQAISELEIIEKRNDELSTCWHDLGRALIPQGRLEEAEQAFDRAIGLMSSAMAGCEMKTTALEARATLQFLLGRSKVAAQSLREAHSLVNEAEKARLSRLKFKSELANLPMSPSMGVVLRGLRTALRWSPNLASFALPFICPSKTKTGK